MKRSKSADAQLRQLKTALRFLADEWEQVGKDELDRETNGRDAVPDGPSGSSRAHFQAAGAIHLLMNMVDTLPEEDEWGPVTAARNVAKAIFR